MTQNEINFLINRVNEITETISTQFQGTRELLTDKPKDELVNIIIALSSVIMTDRKNRGDH